MSKTIERGFDYVDGKYVPTLKIILEPCCADDNSAWEARNLLAERMEELLAAPVAVAPVGWRLVPLYPTMDMLEALMEWSKVGNVNAYNNILSSAPARLDKVKEMNK